ncbi:FAD-dependent monooxygenase [Streptomyces sp. NPDC058067]|uniref:FAD-dependent monooxygenase n=1 Tax=Streptomyces sp. NPDC058067 TaxID=3346324 RepID=UPI0036E44EE3
MVDGGRVAVVGGSVAGCAAARAARRGGAREIVVYERAGDRLAERGLGLAVHDARYAELESAGYLDASMPWVGLVRRRWYVRAGSAGSARSAGDTALGREIAEMPFPFRTYGWGPLWRAPRRAVPSAVEFRAGAAVTRVEATPGGVRVHTAAGGCEEFDVAVGADGYRSVVRACAFPDVQPRYAGYLAWRGAFPAGRLPAPDLWAREDCAYVVFPGGHLITYRIPDGGAEGGLRVNWVLYTAPPPGLDAGLRADLPTSLPPGTLTDALRSHLTYVADELMPPYWGDLVRLTTPAELSLQPLYDFTAPHYASGRLALAGDAATVARPHTGAGAVKALQDATALESAFRSASGFDGALAAYDGARAPSGAAMVGLGRSLGRALVQETPDWRALDAAGLAAWWEQADGTGVFGGRRLDPGAGNGHR